jgi:hypothetical protein
VRAASETENRLNGLSRRKVLDTRLKPGVNKTKGVLNFAELKNN